MMSLAGKVLSPGFLTAVFITLSGVGVGVVSGRQCYWCGPLAEQVHRSRRAPPCVTPPSSRHSTVCEPGYSHCAVVATAPPYMESRYCVKMYQDECYPQFCNTTKTWKMTCPCRGDLCNGANGDRETEAFEVLSKLVNKTHSRIKKRAPNNNVKNKQRKIVNPKDGPEFVDNSLEVQISNENSEMKADSPPIIRSLNGLSENVTSNADNIPSSASSNLYTGPEQNATSSDLATTMIEIRFEQSNPTDSIHKINDAVSHEIEISPEPAIQNGDHGLNMQNNKDESDSREDVQNSINSLKTESTLQTSTLATELVSSSNPIGHLFNTGSSSAEMSVTNADEGTDAHIASVSSAIPLTTATYLNPSTTATKVMTASSLVDQTQLVNSITKQGDTPTAEAFLQDTPSVAKPMEEMPESATVATQPPPVEPVHTTTEILTSLSTTALTRSNAPNISESSNKRSKNKTKNAAATIQVSVLSIIQGIIMSRIIY